MTNKSTGSLIPLALGVGLVFAARAVIRKKRAFDLDGKVVLITGGSRGLGLVLARQLAQQNAKIAICSRQDEQLDRAEAELRGAGADVLALTCDMTVQSDVERMIKRVQSHFGHIDVLINNAGIIQVGPLENLSLHDFEEAMNTNFYGPLYAVMAVLPQMRQRKQGRIVNIASVGGKVSLPHMLPYSASKFALGGLSKGLRSEVSRDGIVVTTVFPGLVRTGSPRNVPVKGNHEAEYAWFKTADSLPLLSATAETTADQIIGALKKGTAELVTTLPGKLLSLMDEVFPELTADIFSLTNRLLPRAATDAAGLQRRYGHEVETGASRNVFAKNSDEAAERNNEM